jgi:hypothetical protein
MSQPANELPRPVHSDHRSKTTRSSCSFLCELMTWLHHNLSHSRSHIRSGTRAVLRSATGTRGNGAVCGFAQPRGKAYTRLGDGCVCTGPQASHASRSSSVKQHCAVRLFFFFFVVFLVDEIENACSFPKANEQEQLESILACGLLRS